MKELDQLIDKAAAGRRLEKEISDAVHELKQLASEAKQTRTEMEGLAWEIVATLMECGGGASVARDSAIYVFRSLGLDAAASALQAQTITFQGGSK